MVHGHKKTFVSIAPQPGRIAPKLLSLVFGLGTPLCSSTCRKIPPNLRIVEKIVARLKYSLVILTEEELRAIFPKQLLLWALMLAGMASTRNVEEDWFLGLLENLWGC